MMVDGMVNNETPGPARPMLDKRAGRAVFGSDAQAYHAVRTGYPEALFAGLRDRCPPRPRILEIGAGSGLATDGLLALDPEEIVIVESDPDFVTFLRARFSHAPVTVINAPFPTADVTGPFDLAVCAAAFHWLDAGVALGAVKGLLAPGGVWAMWWNSYLNENMGDVFAEKAMALLRTSHVPLPPSFGVNGHESLNVAVQRALLESAGLGNVEHWQWQHQVYRETAEVRQLFESFSFLRLLPGFERDRLLGQIAKLVETRFGGRAPGMVVTSCYLAQSQSTNQEQS